MTALAGASAPAPVHSPFGASQAHRWTVCHGSINAQRGLPEETSPYALEGTVGHAVAATCLENNQDAIEWGVGIDDTITEGVQVYLDVIRGDLAEHGGHILVERKFRLTDLHPLFYGTADCVRIGKDGVLSVYDLKLGRGKIVEVTDHGGTRPNLQLGYYALGALRPLAALSLGIKTVELVVVQPRVWHKDGPVRRARFSIAEIEALGPLLVKAAAECEKPDAPRVAGDHCTFCKAQPTCPALRQLAFNTAQLDFDDDKGMIDDRTANPVTMTNEQLTHVLDAIDVIESWISAVRAHAHIIAGTANGLPGWKLVAKQARRKWSDEAKAAGELLLGFGLDEGSIYARNLLSPAQVEKLLSQQERKSPEFKALCPAVSSGTTLVRADNPRPEAKPSQTDFNDGLSDETEW